MSILQSSAVGSNVCRRFRDRNSRYDENIVNMNTDFFAIINATTKNNVPMKVASAQQQEQQLPAPISQSDIKNVDQEITNRGGASSSSR